MLITISYYGAFRRLGNSVTLESEGCQTVRDIKRMLTQKIGNENEALVYDSVLADDVQILNENAVISKSCTLSILPPVCGG